MAVKSKSLEAVRRKLGINKDGRTMAFAIETCYKHMDKYVPKDKGFLRTVVNLSTHSITYEMPYAEVQYYGERNGKKFTHYTTPGTGPYWDKKMLSVETGDVVKEIKNYMKRGK